MRAVLAVAAGIAWGLCFGRQSHPLAAWVALVPLVLLLDGPRAARIGFWHGLASWLVSIGWLAPFLVTYAPLPRAAAWPLVVAGCAYLAIYRALFTWLGRRILRAPLPLALAGLPALWVSIEWLRGHGLPAFPWNLAAYAWTDQPGALPLAAWVGAWGVSFLLVASATAVALGLRHRRELAVAGLLVPLTVLAVGARWGSGGAKGGSELTARGLPVRVLQPDIPTLPEWDGEALARGYARLLRQSETACDRPGALLIWPESAAWPYAWDRDARLRDDLGSLGDRGCAVLLNSSVRDGERYYNSALLVDRDGLVGRYDKRHLVPWGEYVPLGDLLPFVRVLARNAGGFTAASEPSLLAWRGQRFGVAICYEVVFPGEVAETVRGGATALVTVTNDSWYGDSAAPWQHFRAARFRAAENRRPLLRAAITGVSGWIEADGSVRSRLGTGARGVLSGMLRGRRDLAPFSRVPWLVPALSALLAALAIYFGGRRERRDRSPAALAPTARHDAGVQPALGSRPTGGE